MTTVFRAMLRGELVQQVQAKLGELRTPPLGNGPFTKKVSLMRYSSERPNSSKSDLMVTRIASHCAAASASGRRLPFCWLDHNRQRLQPCHPLHLLKFVS
jgi:hypothetical protein